MIDLLRKLNKYCLYLLVLSVTFEYWDPFQLVGTYSITYLSSILYIASWLPLLKYDFQLPPLAIYIWPLAIFLLIGFISSAYNSSYVEKIEDAYNQRVFLLIILMFLIANHIRQDKKLLNELLVMYVVSVLMMFILFQLNIGTQYEKGRLLIFGENPNMLGMKASVAFLIVLSYMLNTKFSFKKFLLGLLIILPIISLVILSASRGAFLSLFIGVSAMIFYLKISPGKKILLAVCGLIIGIFFIQYVFQNNEVFKARLMNTIETGDTGRSDLWEGAFTVIENNLLLGVGYSGALPNMFQAIGRFMDPHNTFLYVLMTTGIFGFIAFSSFIIILVKNLYKNLKKTNNVLYIIIFLVILFNMSKAGGGIGKIFFWFFFALLIGSTLMKPEEENPSHAPSLN